jgi:hypothetical protein
VALVLAVPCPAAPSGDLAPAVRAEVERLQSAAWAHLLELERRLLRVHEPIRVQGLDLCGDKRSPVLGVVAATREEVPESLRDVAARESGVDDAVRVLHVEPGFPGDAGGLLAGDRVLEVNGRRINRAARLVGRRARTERGPLRIVAEREGGRLELELPFVEGCFSPAAVMLADVENAWATQSGVLLVTSGMLSFAARDDELAVVLGHEVAHHVLGHVWSRPVYEQDADYLGLYLAARAGYDISVAPGFWERFGRTVPFSLDQRVWYSHPGSPERAIALRSAVSEIRAKRERGVPLAPEPPT